MEGFGAAELAESAGEFVLVADLEEEVFVGEFVEFDNVAGGEGEEVADGDAGLAEVGGDGEFGALEVVGDVLDLVWVGVLF